MIKNSVQKFLVGESGSEAMHINRGKAMMEWFCLKEMLCKVLVCIHLEYDSIRI
jgi:hypothetical protein